jgi:putative sterol carrier protein
VRTEEEGLMRSGGSANADATARFFEKLAERGHEPLLEKVKGTVRFDLVGGERVERWLVTVDRGDITISRRNAAADCVVRAERALFERIAAGETNTMAAMLRGEVAVEGDLELAASFQRLLPGPRGSTDPRHAAGYARRQT